MENDEGMMKPENRKIHSKDRCDYCGHLAGYDGKPFVIYSSARAKWLEKAAQQMEDIEGDDDWVDWMKEGLRLSEIGD